MLHHETLPYYSIGSLVLIYILIEFIEGELAPACTVYNGVAKLEI